MITAPHALRLATLRRTLLRLAPRLLLLPLVLGACGRSVPPRALPSPLPSPQLQGPVLFSDDFESGDLSSWTGVSGLQLVAGAGEAGSWGARAVLSGSGAYATASLPATETDATASVAVLPTSLTGTSAVNFLKLRETSGRALAEVFVTQSGVLGVRDDVGGVSYHSSVRLSLGAWRSVALHAVVAGGASHLTVSLDGAPVAGLDVAVDFGASAGVGRVQLGENVPGRTAELSFDDVVVSGAEPPPPPPPPPSVPALFSDGFESGDLAAWTGGSGLQVVAGEGTDGSWGVRGAMSGFGAYATADLATNEPDVTASVWVRPVALTGSAAVNFLKLRTASGRALAEAFVTRSGVLGVRDDVAGVSHHSGVELALGAWTQVALHVRVAGASSRLELSLDGAPVDGLQLDADLGSEDVGRVQVGENVGGRTADLVYDDVVVTAPSLSDPVLVAAGDIACDPLSPGFNGGLGTANACRQLAVSDLILADPSVTAVAALGDVQYFCGGAAAFAAAYDPSWGRAQSLTHPAIGNHEYLTGSTTDPNTDCDPSGRAAGYFGYFGAAAGSPDAGYYSYDLGAWHVVVLNSNCPQAGGCGPGSPQDSWLVDDLAAHPTACTLAYWHIPLWSSGGRAARNSASFVRRLYDAGAEVILTGHDHIYERFARQDPDGNPDPAGIRAFVVGTGGSNHTTIDTVAPNSEVRNVDTFGVLRLVLHPDGYDWAFVPEPGGTFADSGSAACH